MRGLLLLSSLFATAFAAPLSLGISFGSGSSSLPILTLPYGSYKAYSYDVTDDYYYFKNIRFAAPPVGDLRWKKPADPLQETGVADGSVGYQCPQALPSTLSFAYPIISNLEPWSEDCLFLDVRVPGSAIRGEVKDLPVLFWIFGGGYVLGSKSFFLYDGHPLLKSASNNLIYVAPNYRLGAFGWLAGPTVESTGLANAGLWDQRKALEWVQSYIGLIGGDKNQVTAMGESAGAGSIMHHLVGNGGTSDPLFKRAILQSPAFEPKYAPAVQEAQYTSFESQAGCAGQGLACLRTKSSDTLQTANLAVIGAAQYGTFGFGPNVDNTYIRDLPAVEMWNGHYWKNVSVIVGHTAEEGLIFADPTKILNSQITSLLTANFPYASAANLRKLLEDLYPPPSIFGPFFSNFERLSQVCGDWVAVCNARAVAAAYAGKAWAYQFSVPPGMHGIDLVFTFWRTDLNIYDIFQFDLDITFLTEKNLATGWQSYLTSFVRSGSPNTYKQSGALPGTITWNQATVGNSVSVLDVNLLGYSNTLDGDAVKDRCDFFNSGVWTGDQ